MRRELDRLEGASQIQVSIQTDEDGYFDRLCPAEECMFEFKVNLEDWHEKVHERAFCPFCGHSAESDDWNTQEQIEHFGEVATEHVSQRLSRAMQRDAEYWNRQQPRDSFIKVTMKMEGRPRHVPLPPAAAEPMRLRIECSQCKCQYAVIGAAFFCPACGHNDAEVVFSLAIAGIRRTLDALPTVRAAVSDRDAAENTVRSLVEHGLQSAVTVFQRYAESLYSQLASVPKPRRNAFQNLVEGSELWHNATRKKYSDYLTPSEMMRLKRAFQQRHILAHTQGIVDQDYITHSSDTSQRVGQRLVIREPTVNHYLDIIEKLTAGLLETTTACLRQWSNQGSQVTDDA
jgi:uncharacterized Zn finger protein (UPF0148 family)